MADRRQIEVMIRKKEQEIQDLEGQVKDAKVYLQALQDVLKRFPKDGPGDGDAETSLRPGSLVARAREAILKRGDAMHVDDILRALGKEVSRTNKTALGGSISAYVRKGEFFTRPAPNTFGLKELQKKSVATEEPPPDFGIDKPKTNDDKDIPF